MITRWYIDPDTGEPHTYAHDVDEDEVADVLLKPIELRRGADDSRVALGQTRAGRYLRVIFVPDPIPNSVFVVTAYDLSPRERQALKRPEEATMSSNSFPPGWDERRVKAVLKHYESQTDEEGIAEDEAAYADTKFTFLQVPTELVPQVQGFIDSQIQG